jgi:hypothetical protein
MSARALLVPVDLALFALGLGVHAVSGHTPRLCFHAMRRLYGPTNGWFNDFALRLARRWRPLDAPAPVRGFLGEFSVAEIDAIVARIDAEGYAMFERRLPPELCDALLAFARSEPALPMGGSQPEVYDPERAGALRYDFAEQAILSNPAACQVALDGTLAAIAGRYFRCLPIYDFTAMWWTTRFGKRDLSKAAQEFHFDMDRLAFLKFFIYLTDVVPDSGPHVFVAGSHRNKPRPLRDPVRFDDALVQAHYPGDAIRHICAPRGSIFAVDTKGIHKGMPVVSGDRLAFQVEFTTSRFGQNYPSPELDAAVLRRAGVATPLDPRVYGNIRVAA